MSNVCAKSHESKSHETVRRSLKLPAKNDTIDGFDIDIKL